MEKGLQEYEKSLLKELIAPNENTFSLEEVLNAIREDSAVWQEVDALLGKENLQVPPVVSMIKSKRIEGNFYLVVQLLNQNYIVIDVKREKSLRKKEVEKLFPPDYFVKEWGEPATPLLNPFHYYQFPVVKKRTASAIIDLYITHEDVFCDATSIVYFLPNELGTASFCVDPHTLQSTLTMEDAKKKNLTIMVLDENFQGRRFISSKDHTSPLLQEDKMDLFFFQEIKNAIKNIRLPKEKLSLRREKNLQLYQLLLEKEKS